MTLLEKVRQFLWEKEQQKAFDEIKHRLQRPPVLHLPDRHGQFQLYSDTSKFATGSVLYQIQNGQPRLIAYASKRMPEAAEELFHHRIRNVWISNEYCYFFSSFKES